MEFFIGLVAHGEVDPCLLIYNALIVGESVKAFFPVAGAHPAFSEASESHLAGGKVDDGVIDASAPESTAGSDFFGGLLLFGEDIESQRMRHGVDVADGFIQCIVGKDRH